MADIKLSGHADLAKLAAKRKTWDPPFSFGEYLTLLGQVILCSRYKDMYRELDPRDLQGLLRVKAHRCLRDGELDLEEVVDVGAYAGLLYMRMTPPKDDVKLVVRKSGPTVEVGAPGQLDQVNKPPPPPPPAPPPPKTANENCLLGMRCPKCKSLGPLSIAVACIAVVHDDGIDDTDHHEWTGKSWCRCLGCGYEATVRSFKERRPKKK